VQVSPLKTPLHLVQETGSPVFKYVASHSVHAPVFTLHKSQFEVLIEHSSQLSTPAAFLIY